MFNKKKYSILSLPIFVLTSACASTGAGGYQPRDHGPEISSRSVAQKVVKPMRTTAQTALTRAPYALSDNVQPAPWLVSPAAAGAPQGSTMSAQHYTARSAPSPRPIVANNMMGIGRSEEAPQGLYDLCVRNPDICNMGQARMMRASQPIYPRPIRESGFMLASSRSSWGETNVDVQRNTSNLAPIVPIAWTAQTRQLVNRVNRQINNDMVGVTDQIAFGRQELWALPLSEPDRPRGRAKPLGDCEDFALEKRKSLMAAGIPESALYLAVAVSVQTGLHAVLVISTEEGDFVLDNMSEWLVEWSQTNYVWIKRQASTSLLDWANTRPATRERDVVPQPEFVRENPVILASLDPVPAFGRAEPFASFKASSQNGASFTTAAINPATSADWKQANGLRGFTSDIQPSYVAAGNSTSSVAPFATAVATNAKFLQSPKGPSAKRLPSHVMALAIAAKTADRKLAQSSQGLVKLDKAFASLGDIKAAARTDAGVSYARIVTPRSERPSFVASQAPSSVSATLADGLFQLALAQDTQSLPAQTEWFVGVDGYFVAITPQKMPAFATLNLDLASASQIASASLHASASQVARNSRPDWVTDAALRDMAALN